VALGALPAISSFIIHHSAFPPARLSVFCFLLSAFAWRWLWVLLLLVVCQVLVEHRARARRASSTHYQGPEFFPGQPAFDHAAGHFKFPRNGLHEILQVGVALKLVPWHSVLFGKQKSCIK
jgi:hypothetical protein